MGRNRPVIYCVVPQDLAGDLHERLREFYADDPAVEVIVEQRGADRRRRASRRRANAARTLTLDRRRIRAQHGRRVEERRGVQVATAPRALPPEIDVERSRVRFFERLEPPTLALEDADSARLVARIQSGHPELFRELYLRYFDRVYTYLRIALRDADEAEDAAQDVFMRVLQAIPRYERRGDVPFRAWLFRIVRNCAITRLRRRGRYTLETPLTLARASEKIDYREDDALQRIADPQLITLIEHLPLAQRQVIALRYMLDLSTKEIADVLGRSDGAVRQLHHRALEALRGCLEPPTGEEIDRRLGHVHRQPMVRALRPSPVLRARRQVA